MHKYIMRNLNYMKFILSLSLSLLSDVKDLNYKVCNSLSLSLSDIIYDFSVYRHVF